jgi:hypothetical protein
MLLTDRHHELLRVQALGRFMGSGEGVVWATPLSVSRVLGSA